MKKQKPDRIVASGQRVYKVKPVVSNVEDDNLGNRVLRDLQSILPLHPNPIQPQTQEHWNIAGGQTSKTT